MSKPNDPRYLWQLKTKTTIGNRPNPHKHLYNRKRWQRMSRHWRAEYPICFECALLERLTPADHVDHIIPHRGDVGLFFDWDNLQSLCASHHAAKTSGEIRYPFGGPWEFDHSRIVVAGLPATGKTTFAESLDIRYWDLDQQAGRMGFPKYPRPDAVVEELGRRRDEFLAHPGPCCCIVANPTWAARLAQAAHLGFVHMHCPEVDRQQRLAERVKEPTP